MIFLALDFSQKLTKVARPRTVRSLKGCRGVKGLNAIASPCEIRQSRGCPFLVAKYGKPGHDAACSSVAQLRVGRWHRMGSLCVPVHQYLVDCSVIGDVEDNGGQHLPWYWRAEQALDSQVVSGSVVICNVPAGQPPCLCLAAVRMHSTTKLKDAMCRTWAPSAALKLRRFRLNSSTAPSRGSSRSRCQRDAFSNVSVPRIPSSGHPGTERAREREREIKRGRE